MRPYSQVILGESCHLAVYFSSESEEDLECVMRSIVHVLVRVVRTVLRNMIITVLQNLLRPHVRAI